MQALHFFSGRLVVASSSLRSEGISTRILASRVEAISWPILKEQPKLDTLIDAMITLERVARAGADCE
jgi:hypothetical protein